MSAFDHLSVGQFGQFNSRQRLVDINNAVHGMNVRPEDHVAVVGMLARSRVPAGHLAGITAVHTNDPETRSTGAAAEYVAGNRGEGSLHYADDLNTTTQQGYLADVTTHEVGHHRHHVNDPHRQRGGARSEAIADNYTAARLGTPVYPPVLNQRPLSWQHDYLETRGSRQVP